MIATDKQQQLQLEVNVLKEKERSRKSVDKYSKKIPSLSEKENLTEYDWSSAINTKFKTLKKSRKSTDVASKPKESQDDAKLHLPPKRHQRQMSLSLSDSEMGFRDEIDDEAYYGTSKDAREVLSSLAMKKNESRKSTRGTREDLRNTPTVTAREKFEKLNRIYQRVTGDRSVQDALQDDDESDD